MAVALTYTVTMDARLAEIVGIPAAMLYNLLLWQSDTDMSKDYDEDGWFYFTAERFAEKTTFNQNTFTNAAKKLVDAGLIERKRAYIKYGHGNAGRSASHFRMKMDLEEFLVTRNVSKGHTKCDLYIKEEKKEEEKQFTQSDELSSTQPSAESSKDELDSVQLPFDELVKEVAPTSIRPDKDKNAAARQRQEFAILGDIRKHFGFEKGGDSRVERKLVHDRLSDGWSKAEIIKVVAWLKENKEWYKDKTLRHCLGKEAFDEYQAANGTGNSSDFFAGMTDEQIHVWKMNHDPEYAEEFKRKVREAGNL